MEIKDRAIAIRVNTPDCIEELFEMQNRICDLCGHPIQDLILADIDHSIPVSRYAKALDIAIEDAIRECNHSDNLRVAHVSCNRSKNNLTRDEWFAKGLNKREKPGLYTEKELGDIKFKRLANIRVMREKKLGFFNNDVQRELSKRAVASITPEQRRLNGVKGGTASVAKMSEEEKYNRGKYCGTYSRDHKIGVHVPGMAAKANKIAREKKVGIWAPGFDRTKGLRKYVATLTKEQRSARGLKGAMSLTHEQRVENGRKGQIKSYHNANHVKLGVISPDCPHCQEPKCTP